MVEIEGMGFGWIIINGRKHRHDIIIFPDGKVERRKGGILMFGNHLFKQKEFEELCKQEVDAIIVGTGTEGVAKISDEARKFLESRRIKLIELLSAEAIKEFNKLAKEGKKVGGIIHVTC
jgi:hypothetical protein